jgi:hypothetical protein
MRSPRAATVLETCVKVEQPRELRGGYRDDATPGALRVTCHSGRDDLLATIPAAIFFGVVALWLADACAELRTDVPEPLWSVVIGGLALTSLGFAYASLALACNRTVFSLGPRGLSCAQGPIPWRVRTFEVPTDQLLGFEVERHDRGRRLFKGASFDVIVRTREGTTTMLWALPDLERAMRVTEVLSRHLRATTAPEDRVEVRAGDASEVRTAAARRFARLVESSDDPEARDSDVESR